MENRQEGLALQISDGQTQIPYQEFTYTIAAGANQEIFQVFNYFRVLALTGSGLSLQFGNNGLVTPFTGQGVGIQLAFTYSRLRLINTSGASMTITIAIALGTVNDDRLSISSSLTIGELIPGVLPTDLGKQRDAAVGASDTGVLVFAQRNDSLATVPVSLTNDYSPISVDYRGAIHTHPACRAISTSQTSVTTAATLLVSTAGTNGELLIAAGLSDLYIGGTSGVTTANGFLIPAGSTFGLNGCMGDIYGIRSSGSDTAYVLRGTY